MSKRTKKTDPRILVGSCLDRLKELDDASIDSIVTDPPYELGFMGKKWDSSGIAYNVDLWAECLRVLKPGGHLLAFGGTRTYHRMAVAIEDAGFEIRDSLHWVYGSGFPKSHNVSKAIDKMAGAEREVVGSRTGAVNPNGYKTDGTNQSGGAFAEGAFDITAPATDAAKQWSGWGTALKPAHEPIVLARKPLDGTVAANVQEHGTGALNIDGCRVRTNESWTGRYLPNASPLVGYEGGDGLNSQTSPSHALGRWPANVITDGSIEEDWTRYFYVAKPGKKERNAGLEKLKAKTAGEATDREDGSAGLNSPRAGAGRTGGSRNFHPTVKPVALMRYLVRLVTPPNGTVLDPFLGSGTTAVAAILEGFTWVGCEMTTDYLPIIKGRVKWAEGQQQTLFEGDVA